MSTKVDNIDVAVPEASPDSNEKSAGDPPKKPSASPNRKWMVIGVAGLLIVVITLAIALPLALKEDGSDNNEVKPNSANATQVVHGGDESREQLPSGMEQCPPPSEGADCITEQSHKECMDLVNSGCQKIYSTFSCPPLHRCGDEPAQPDTQPDQQLSASQCQAPIEGDNCITDDSYQECQKLENEGCNVIIATASCPPHYSCADQPRRCSRELAPCADGTPVGRSPPSCHFEACPDGGCPVDTYTCDDGTELLRDPAIGCEFHSCPAPLTQPSQLPEEEAPVMCTMDVKECPDGSFVGRAGPDCEFEACPAPVLVACTMELRYCADGTPVGRSGPNCHFETCPDGGCPTDTYHCDNGIELKRDPALGCEFEACPTESAPLNAASQQCQPPVKNDKCETEASYQECMGLVNSGCQLIIAGYSCPPIYSCGDESQPVLLPAQLPENEAVMCTMDVQECPDGSFVGRVGPDCEFEACPPPAIAACTMELRYCADGTSVGRRGPSCHFESCPDGSCPTDTYTCNDGTELLREPSSFCEFPACPAPAACPRDLGICADGTSVGRTSPNCDFAACPDGGCTIDTFLCSDGTEVSRDINNNCQFPACPGS